MAKKIEDHAGDPLAAAAAADAAAALPGPDAPGVEGAAPGATPAAPAGPDYRQEAVELLRFALAVAVPYFRSLGDVWTREAQADFADAAAPVMEKYHFTLGSLQSLPELRFAVVALPLMVKTTECVRLEIEARRAAAAKDVSSDPAAPAAPAAAGV